MINEFIIGIDEAGRGPLAGPVAVGVFAIKKGYKIKNFPKGKDSKKMSENEREYWYEVFRKGKSTGNLNFVVRYASSKDIDKKRISICIKNCIERGLYILNKAAKINCNTRIFLDGNLKAPINFKKQETIIKGDEKVPVIAYASIVAKVSRDRLMKKLSKKYPAYGFDKHKGYGTKYHRKMIAVCGTSIIHRKTYCKKI